MRARSALFTASLTAALLLAGCGGGEDATPADDGGEATATTGTVVDAPDLGDVEWKDETGKAAVTIITRDNTFSPQFIEVSPGTEVTWDNRGRTEHNAITSIDGKFESVETADLEPGETATRTFEEPGDYPYFCSLHGTKTKGMYGAIRVVGS